jgi:hypothetical protein
MGAVRRILDACAYPGKDGEHLSALFALVSTRRQ